MTETERDYYERLGRLVSEYGDLMSRRKTLNDEIERVANQFAKVGQLLRSGKARVKSDEGVDRLFWVKHDGRDRTEERLAFPTVDALIELVAEHNKVEEESREVASSIEKMAHGTKIWKVVRDRQSVDDDDYSGDDD